MVDAYSPAARPLGLSPARTMRPAPLTATTA